jgi:hypothetical protein
MFKHVFKRMFKHKHVTFNYENCSSLHNVSKTSQSYQITRKLILKRKFKMHIVSKHMI